jgi:hypothetical protein
LAAELLSHVLVHKRRFADPAHRQTVRSKVECRIQILWHAKHLMRCGTLAQTRCRRE